MDGRSGEKMICPNCRCYLPGTADVCGYCGREFPKGDEPTTTVSVETFRSGYSRQLTACQDPQSFQNAFPAYYPSADNEQEQQSEIESALLLTLCSALIIVLLLLAVLVLIM